MSEDLIHIVNTTVCSGFGAGIYGGITTSRFTFINFIDTNEATQFRTQGEAKKILSDKMVLSFFRGFVKYGSRVALFVGIFQ